MIQWYTFAWYHSFIGFTHDGSAKIQKKYFHYNLSPPPLIAYAIFWKLDCILGGPPDISETTYSVCGDEVFSKCQVWYGGTKSQKKFDFTHSVCNLQTRHYENPNFRNLTSRRQTFAKFCTDIIFDIKKKP